MRIRALIGALSVLVALAAVAVAVAEGPTFRTRTDISIVDDDFCDTGQTVLIDAHFVVNGWGGDPGQQLTKRTVMVTVVYTNPANGLSAVEHRAFTENEISLVEDPEGSERTVTSAGLAAMLKLQHGGVLTFDAGSITVRVTFDADGNFTGEEVTALHGPHPGFFLENRCSVLTEALGL